MCQFHVRFVGEYSLIRLTDCLGSGRDPARLGYETGIRLEALHEGVEIAGVERCHEQGRDVVRLSRVRHMAPRDLAAVLSA